MFFFFSMCVFLLAAVVEVEEAGGVGALPAGFLAMGDLQQELEQELKRNETEWRLCCGIQGRA